MKKKLLLGIAVASLVVGCGMFMGIKSNAAANDFVNEVSKNEGNKSDVTKKQSTVVGRLDIVKPELFMLIQV